MEFIDKTKQKSHGEKIVSDFLNEFHGIYRKNLYSEFKNPRKQELVKLLLEEQNNRCCYCMKSLDVQKDYISLEHLIPQSTNEKMEFDKYITEVTNKEDEDMLLSFFENESYWNLLKKYNYFSKIKILSRQLTRLKEVELTVLVENIKTNLQKYVKDK